MIGSVTSLSVLIFFLKLHLKYYYVTFIGIVLVAYVLLAVAKVLQFPNLCWLYLLVNVSPSACK